MKCALNVFFASAAVLSVGCASVEKEEPLASQQPSISALDVPEGGIRYDTDDSRVADLWTAAEQARRAQNTDLALQRLFQALEIAPQNSLLWSRAAEIQLGKQEGAVAENFAMKSNTFAGTNLSLLHRNWLIIEHARSLRGDLLGVRSAHKKVQEYQYR